MTAQPDLWGEERPAEAPAEPEPPTPAPTLGQRQRAAIDAGMHPLSIHPAAPKDMRLTAVPGRTCGDCALRKTVRGYGHPKCTLGASTHRPRGRYWTWRDDDGVLWHAPLVARSHQTDCRALWPACTSWTDRDDRTPDRGAVIAASLGRQIDAHGERMRAASDPTSRKDTTS